MTWCDFEPRGKNHWRVRWRGILLGRVQKLRGVFWSYAPGRPPHRHESRDEAGTHLRVNHQAKRV